MKMNMLSCAIYLLSSFLTIITASAQEGGPINVKATVVATGTGARVTQNFNILKDGRVYMFQTGGKPCSNSKKNSRIGEEFQPGETMSYQQNCGGAKFNNTSRGGYSNGRLSLTHTASSSAGLYSSVTNIQVTGDTCKGTIEDSFDGKPMTSWKVVACRVSKGIDG